MVFIGLLLVFTLGAIGTIFAAIGWLYASQTVTDRQMVKALSFGDTSFSYSSAHVYQHSPAGVMALAAVLALGFAVVIYGATAAAAMVWDELT